MNLRGCIYETHFNLANVGWLLWALASMPCPETGQLEPFFCLWLHVNAVSPTAICHNSIFQIPYRLNIITFRNAHWPNYVILSSKNPHSKEIWWYHRSLSRSRHFQENQMCGHACQKGAIALASKVANFPTQVPNNMKPFPSTCTRPIWDK